jgi:3-polyprenyl-4-hydroxybenzoate decarboxylase
VDSIDDIERFIKEISEEKNTEKKHTYFEDAKIAYKQAYLAMFSKLGIDDTDKQNKTTVSTYYAKIVEIQKENAAKQSQAANR